MMAAIFIWSHKSVLSQVSQTYRNVPDCVFIYLCYNMHTASEHYYKEWLCDICVENYLFVHPHSVEIDFYKI